MRITTQSIIDRRTDAGTPLLTNKMSASEDLFNMSNIPAIEQTLSELEKDIGRFQASPLVGPPVPCDHRCGYLDVMDFTNIPERTFNYVMYYREQTTRFTFLRALNNDTPTDIAAELHNIFNEISFLQPSPEVLHTRSTRAFEQSIVDAMDDIVPGYFLYITKFKNNEEFIHEEFLYRVRKIKRDLLKMMKVKHRSEWLLECYLTAQSLNDTFDQELGESPSTAMLGADPRRRG